MLINSETFCKRRRWTIIKYTTYIVRGLLSIPLIKEPVQTNFDPPNKGPPTEMCSIHASYTYNKSSSITLDRRDIFSLIISSTHSYPTVKDVWIIPSLTHAPPPMPSRTQRHSLSHSLSLALFSTAEEGQGGEVWGVALHRGCARTVVR